MQVQAHYAFDKHSHTHLHPAEVSLFRPEDIACVGLQDYVRKNQKRYFRSGSYSAVETAALIAMEAVPCGASDVRITNSDGWISVSADLDWLAEFGEAVFR